MNDVSPQLDAQADEPDYTRYFEHQPTAELAERLAEAERLKAELDACRTVDALAPRWEAVYTMLRHHWTYHSNAIEGSTLTLGETIFFLQEGLTVEGKPLKDFLDARNHAEAIELLFEFVAQGRPITEGFLKELNALLLHGVTETPALDTFGRRTSKPARPGEYKQRPNHVLQQDGTIHYYVEPEQVAAQMAYLCDWLQANQDALHPVVLASLGHYNLVRIHPFDDGNGRGARLLMNCLLMRAGYPPAIVYNEQLRRYLDAIQAADRGQLSPFIAFVAQSLTTTQQEMLKALRGEAGA